VDYAHQFGCGPSQKKCIKIHLDSRWTAENYPDSGRVHLEYVGQSKVLKLRGQCLHAIEASQDSILVHLTKFCFSRAHHDFWQGIYNLLYHESINSAGHVMHYMPAKILDSAHGGKCSLHRFFSVGTVMHHQMLHHH
jgi:hypothetical protein